MYRKTKIAQEIREENVPSRVLKREACHYRDESDHEKNHGVIPTAVMTMMAAPLRHSYHLSTQMVIGTAFPNGSHLQQPDCYPHITYSKAIENLRFQLHTFWIVNP